MGLYLIIFTQQIFNIILNYIKCLFWPQCYETKNQLPKEKRETASMWRLKQHATRSKTMNQKW